MNRRGPLLAVLLAACAPAKAPAPPRDGTELYRDVEHLARDTLPIRLLDADRARGTRHVRVRWEAGRIVRVEQIAPSGIVQGTERIDHAADGSRRVWHWSGYGELAWTLLVGKDGRATRTLRSGASWPGPCVSQRLAFDAQGRAAEIACLDLSGEPIPDEQGCPVTRLEYDEAGSMTSEWCFKADGSPAEVHARGHHVVHTLDAEGRRRAVARFDAEGAPVRDKDGCVTESFQLDERGELASATCRDAAGNPVGRGGGPVAIRMWTRDANGCEIREERRDSVGALVEELGEAIRVYERDAQCTALRIERRASSGALFASLRRPAITEMTLTPEGRIAEERCRSADERPASCIDAAGAIGAVQRFEYDNTGLQVLRRCFDAAGAKTDCSRDYPHQERQAYDATGNEAFSTYLDAAGAPAPALGNVAKTLSSHDAAGRRLSVRYFGVDGRPVVPTTRCFEIRYSYDLVGRLLALDCRDPAGELVTANVCTGGVCWVEGAARVVVERLPGRVANLYLDRRGDLVKRLDCASAACYE